MGTDSSNSQRGESAPYAPPATVLGVIRHFRGRDVPDELTKGRMTQIGVSDGLMNRTWAALEFLGLIQPDGTTMDGLRNLRFASEDEYKQVLAGILQNAYSLVFSVLDPNTADDLQLANAFRAFSPAGQRSRMITLFLGLCNEAGFTPKVRQAERGSQVGGRGPRKRVTRPSDAGQKEKKSESNGEERKDDREKPKLSGLDEIRREYAAHLFDQVKASEGEPNSDLLDRLERALGLEQGDV